MPTSSKDPRTLQRFPRRNQEISNFILRTTGEHRTAKQVGSRLQQLRESCSDEHSQSLFSPHLSQLCVLKVCHLFVVLNLIQSKVFGADRDRRRRSTPYFNSTSDAFWDSLSQPCSSPTQVVSSHCISAKYRKLNLYVLAERPRIKLGINSYQRRPPNPSHYLSLRV